MGSEVGGGFRMGNTCTLMADSSQCMAKPIQYCKVKWMNELIFLEKGKKKPWCIACSSRSFSTGMDRHYQPYNQTNKFTI